MSISVATIATARATAGAAVTAEKGHRRGGAADRTILRSPTVRRRVADRAILQIRRIPRRVGDQEIRQTPTNRPRVALARGVADRRLSRGAAGTRPPVIAVIKLN
jgi:2-hydroxychromene-2-carboxylate isomerase